MENTAFAAGAEGEMENAPLDFGAAMAPPPVAYPGVICRVLLIEEDPSYLATLTQMLQHRGCPVTAKASPEEGLRALRDNPEGFDLVMTVAHTQGTGIDGFELLKNAGESYPVILFSDHAPPETVMRAILAGACDFLTKPMHDNEIRGIWQHVLRRQLDLDSGAAAAADAETSDVVICQDVKARKSGSGELHGSDDDGSDGSQQQKQGRTTKKTKFNSSPEQHVMPVKAAEQLRGTKVVEAVEQKEGSGEHVRPPCQDESTCDRI